MACKKTYQYVMKKSGTETTIHLSKLKATLGSTTSTHTTIRATSAMKASMIIQSTTLF